MKSLAIAAAIAAFFGSSARAQNFDIAYSSFIVVGVQINSAPEGATLVNSRPHGFYGNVAKYRFTNSHPTWDIFVGDVNLTTGAFSANLGHVIKANGGTVDFPVGKDTKRGGLLAPIYARPADTTSAALLPRLSVTWFAW